MAAALIWFWSLRGLRDEGRTWVDQALSVPGEASWLALALCYGGRAMMSGGSGAMVEAKWSLGRAMRIVHKHPGLISSHPLGIMLELIAAMTVPSRASRVEAEIGRAREHPNSWTRAAALMAYGHWAENQGRALDAERLFQRALGEFREIGDRWGLASTLESIAQIGELRGDLNAVIEIEHEALGLLTELEAHEDVAQGLSILARQQARVGEFDAAVVNIERAAELAHRYSDAENRLWVEATASEIDRRRGDLATARRGLTTSWVRSMRSD